MAMIKDGVYQKRGSVAGSFFLTENNQQGASSGVNRKEEGADSQKNQIKEQDPEFDDLARSFENLFGNK